MDGHVPLYEGFLVLRWTLPLPIWAKMKSQAHRRPAVAASISSLVGGVAAVGAAVGICLRQSRHTTVREKTVLGVSRGLGLVLAGEFAARGAGIGISATNLNESAMSLPVRGIPLLIWRLRQVSSLRI